MALGAVAQPAGAQQHLWQADLQIRSFDVAESKGSLVATVVVGAEAGEAVAAKVEVLLPVGVGIVRLGKGCEPGPSAPGVPSLHARVICTIGNLRPRDPRSFSITTTMPPTSVASRFGAMATSDTPDPKPGNNFAEREIPHPKRRIQHSPRGDP